MSVVVKHYYHSHLHSEELDEIMADVQQLPISNTLRAATHRFLEFAQAAMLGILNCNCVLIFIYENGVYQCRFIIDNPLTNQAFLMVQLSSGLTDALDALEYEFTTRKYVRVYGGVTARNTSMINKMPFSTVRESLFDYMLDLVPVKEKAEFRSFGTINLDNLRDYAHLNDVGNGSLKMIRRYPSEDHHDGFNVTVQLVIQPMADLAYENMDAEQRAALDEEARVALAN